MKKFRTAIAVILMTSVCLGIAVTSGNAGAAPAPAPPSYPLACTWGKALNHIVAYPNGAKTYAEVTTVTMANHGFSTGAVPGTCAWASRGGRGSELTVRRVIIPAPTKSLWDGVQTAFHTISTNGYFWGYAYRTTPVPSDPWYKTPNENVFVMTSVLPDID